MAPKAVDAVETLQPESTLSRAWPAPTRVRPISRAGGASTGDIQGALPLFVHLAGSPPRANGPRGGHGPLLQQLARFRGRWRADQPL